MSIGRTDRRVGNPVRSDAEQLAALDQEGGHPVHFDLNHLLSQYGYAGVFAILVLEMVGIPFPAETTLIVSGIAWTRGSLLLLPLLFASACGNIIGSLLAYGIGRFLRPWVIRLGRYVGITQERLDRVGTRFGNHQGSILVSSKFIAGIRVIVPYVAGIHRMPFVPFLMYTTIGAFLWSAAFILLGRYIGIAWHSLYRHLHAYMWPTVTMLAAFGGCWFVFHKRHHIQGKSL